MSQPACTVVAAGQAGGGVLLTRTVVLPGLDRLLPGLDRLLPAALSQWRKPLAVHDPGKIVCT